MNSKIFVYLLIATTLLISLGDPAEGFRRKSKRKCIPHCRCVRSPCPCCGYGGSRFPDISRRNG